jgi:hypothetical protein
MKTNQSKLQTTKQTVNFNPPPNDDPIDIRILEYTVTVAMSKNTGFEYEEMRIRYEVLGGDSTNSKFYRAAGFSRSGKAIKKADIQVGNVYHIKREVNDKQFIDWLSVTLVAMPNNTNTLTH